jgi:hypothetical protein
MYGLEIVQPKQTNLKKLEVFQKNILKQILSLPTNAPDPAIYIISGLLPIEAILDIKYITLFNNICRQHDDAIEKQLETRQLNIKITESKSWFTILKKTFKYDFSNINELVAKPPKKSIWKSLIMKAVERYWANKIREIATWYPSLECLNSEIYKPKLYHPILDISRDLNPSKAAMTIGMRNMHAYHHSVSYVMKMLKIWIISYLNAKFCMLLDYNISLR